MRGYGSKGSEEVHGIIEARWDALFVCVSV